MTAVAASANPPLFAVYRAMHRRWGPQHWWPGRTRFEIVVGAILTQNTAWRNVEKAIASLRRHRALSPRALHDAPAGRVAQWIRPAGFFRVKARRLRFFTTMLRGEFGGSLDRLFALPTARLRKRLLDVHGIGPETADSILLYAARRPVFVIDAYTRRMLARHGWLDRRASYDEAARLFERTVPRRTAVRNEYHALLVALGKAHCRAKPVCVGCPLQRWLPAGGPRS